MPTTSFPPDIDTEIMIKYIDPHSIVEAPFVGASWDPYFQKSVKSKLNVTLTFFFFLKAT